MAGAGRNIPQPFLVAFAWHFKGALCGRRSFITLRSHSQPRITIMEEASYELNLRLWNMTKDKLCRRSASSENTEHTNMQLLEAFDYSET